MEELGRREAVEERGRRERREGRRGMLCTTAAAVMATAWTIPEEAQKLPVQVASEEAALPGGGGWMRLFGRSRTSAGP